MSFEVIIMHLTISKSANAVSYYVSETVTKDGKKTTAVIEKLVFRP
jgi:hypothetical protein